MSSSPLGIARACLKAYVDRDLAAMERLLDKDFHFTSPLDNALDRATYFKSCWPNSAGIVGFNCVYEGEVGDWVGLALGSERDYIVLDSTHVLVLPITNP